MYTPDPHDHWGAAAAQAERLARERGWRLAKKPFTLAQLKEARRNPNRDEWGEHESHYPQIDHAYHFRAPDSLKPIAILSHAYCTAQMCMEFAQRHHLAAEVLPESAYFPGYAIAVLYRRGLL